jgi:hypothetical protein
MLLSLGTFLSVAYLVQFSNPGSGIVIEVFLIGGFLSGLGYCVLGFSMLLRNRLRAGALHTRMAALPEHCPAVSPRLEVTQWGKTLATAWQTIRWVEETQLSPSACIRIVAPGQLWLDAPVRLTIDGALVAEAEEESGFDVEVHLCPGTHYLEFRSGTGSWSNEFYAFGEGRHQVRVVALRRQIVQLTVQSSELARVDLHRWS